MIAPTVTPNGGKFKRTAKVTIKTPTRGARIYYTTNGKTPTTRSTRYRKPIWLKRNTTLKAIAVAPGHKKSAVTRTKFSSPATSLDNSGGSPTKPAGKDRAYGGKAWPVPGTIEAENFDLGGEGVAYHDTTRATNTGGRYRKDAVDIWRSKGGYYTGAIRIPKTGAPNRWRTASRDVRLSAGKHVLRLDFLRGGLNLDWIDVY